MMPYPKSTAYDERATPSQIRYITLLCQRLKIKEPLEEKVQTIGEAGRLIRELEEREKRGKGNPNNPVTTKKAGDFLAFMGLIGLPLLISFVIWRSRQ